MAKISFLLPDAGMTAQAIEEANHYGLDVLNFSFADKDNTAQLAEFAKKNGADIIVSRGTIALVAARAASLPVIEIKLRLFDLELLIEKAKKAVSKSAPFIALTGSKNIFPSFDEDFFSERHGIRFKAYLHNNPGSSVATTIQAVADGADVIIGGPGPEKYCAEHQIPFVKTTFSREGITEACRSAQMMSAIIDQERSHSRQMDIILDHIDSGFIQIDNRGTILFVNSFIEHLLSMSARRIQGQPVWNFLPKLEKNVLKSVLQEQKDIPFLPAVIGNTSFVLSISPVIVGGKTDSAVIWLYEGIQADRREYAVKSKLLQYSPIDPDSSFRSLIARNQQSQQVVKTAEHYARFRLPVLLTGPMGTEKHTIAECIHNASQFRDCPFIRFNCGSDPEKNLKQIISGHFPMGSGGDTVAYRGSFTLYLHEVSALSWAMQYQIASLLQENAVRADNDSSRCIRVIASARDGLGQEAAEGTFRRELFYFLNIAVLELLPLSKRREDIMGWFDYYLQRYQSFYGRYIRLTADAQKYLNSYSWPGNLTEMRTLCQRILVNCSGYYVNAENVREQIAGLSPDSDFPGAAASVPGKTFPDRAAEIRRLLSLYGGSREATAAALGVSTTTLWRWMKKAGIEKTEGKV